MNKELYMLDDQDLEKGEVLRDAIDDYLKILSHQYREMPGYLARDNLLSEYNYQIRGKMRSCRPFGITISPGDICYIDFGRAYLTEAGYQHFGLVISVFCGKAFVIPMTSNETNYQQAYDETVNPQGLRHLMRLGKVEGLYKKSVLFLNDGKFINTARVIDVKGHIDPESALFKKVRRRLMECL